MKKSVLMFSLLSGTALMFPRLTIASGLPAHTLTYTPEPKPAFQFEQLDKAYQTTGICFLGVGDCDPNVGFASSGSSSGGNDDYTVNTTSQCLNEGFSKQNCNSVQTIDGVCPYNSAYGLGCKCVSNLVSCPAGQVGVGESCDEMYASCECDPALVACSSKEVGQGASCGGRYESCVCKPEYQYTSSNCSYPRSVSGDSCGGQYTGCVCPAGVDEGPYGCAEYYPSPCSSVCKVAYSDNCHVRESVNVPYYCEKYWDDCPSKCEVAAIDNCINRTAVSVPYYCEKYWDDCPSKCQIASGDNCRNRTAAISSCPSNASCSYYSDCSSKISSWSCNSGYTQSGSSCIKNDPCDNRTAVISSCPSNASCSYFSDCPSKISSWSCNSGYKKSGNSCLKLNDSCPVGYSKSDGCSCSYGFKATRTEAGSLCIKCCTAAQNPNGYQCMQCFNPDAGLRH